MIFFRNPLLREKYNFWLKEQHLRDSKALIGAELFLENINILNNKIFIKECHCGGQFSVETFELKQISNYGLFECSNCSLFLKVYLNKINEQQK